MNGLKTHSKSLASTLWLNNKTALRSRGSLQTWSKTDLWPRQFYAPVVPDASSRGRMIYGEITSFKSTHKTYSLIHIPFIDVEYFWLFKCKCYIKITDSSCNDALMTYVIDMIFTVGIQHNPQKTTEFQFSLMLL